MTIGDLFYKVRKITHTLPSTLPDSRLFNLVNQAYLDIQRRLASEEIQVLGTIKKADLVAGQANYQLPTDLLAIVRVEINYDDPSDNSKWIKMTEADLPNLSYEFYELLNKQPKSQPLYDLFAGYMWTFPAPTQNQVQGLRLFYIQRQPDFTSTNDTLPPAIDKYWDVLAYGTAYAFFQEIGDPRLAETLQLYEAGLARLIQDYKTDTVEPIKTISPYRWWDFL